MKLQDRDLEILKFINKFGYVSTDNIAKLFKLTKPRTSQILNRLIDNDYIKKQRMLVNKPAIYLLRSKATDLLGVNRVKKVSLQNLEHNLAVIEVYVDLKLENPETNIKSDRELRSGIKFKKQNRKHIPDLVVDTEELNGKRGLAIEVELTRKSKDRLKSIGRSYAYTLDYVGVAYYCSSSAYTHVRRHLLGQENMKIVNYFGDVEEPKPNITKAINYVSNANAEKIRSLTNELQGSKREKANAERELERLNNRILRFKDMFESANFKKATFGNSYSLSGEEFERLRDFISRFD